VLVGACESLTPLVGPAVVRAHAHDLEKLGVGDGDQVRLRSGRGDIVVAVAADESLPRGVAAVDFNLAGGGGEGDGVSALIDARQAVVDVRMETP
jgi:anaerobic selenocysteine-containing dehydrogenase